MNKNVEQYMAFKRGEIRIPEHLKPKKEQSAKLYKNQFIEFLSKAPFWVPHLQWVVIFLVFMFLSFAYTSLGYLEIVLTAIGGGLTWTFMEYVVHRFAYHTEVDSQKFLDFQMSMHGNHHHYPKDPERLAMPPIPGLFISALLFGLFYLIMGIYAFAFFPGFILAYDAYITLHYYQHRIKSPRYKPWKKLWMHHKAHHYSNPYSAFGVSTRLWDWVFGTMPKKSNEKREVQVEVK
jgi:sterol desaturase/sphingolipid hydroxylase (fatty acid hydroxylase superfamily)